ncbi:hypothetical protein POTOM_017040 [Populus tomentosa]|uniref:Uncharacterized protein n=1 Tax=Populus tomentosa TaxID=118781 RepID=A0A8X7ZU95_POPTO|nr:hypothetical protein POTOM_017040 [Populus tomentosa]
MAGRDDGLLGFCGGAAEDDLVSVDGHDNVDFFNIDNLWVNFAICLVTEILMTKITPLKEKVEVTEGGDAMEE